jgi:hypothetical protein
MKRRVLRCPANLQRKSFEMIPAAALTAAQFVLLDHGITPTRQDILQNGNTLVVRLTDDLVARVVQDVSGPRQGTDWFARENAVAAFLSEQGAPVIPLHTALPAGPHFHQGFPMNFWQYVQAVDLAPAPEQIGSTLFHCHEILNRFPEPLPKLAIIEESLSLLPRLEMERSFPGETIQLLRRHLERALTELAGLPHQPLHGDAHMGNLLNTTQGLLWTDWEDAFSGPVEWDLASIIWNAQILEHDFTTVDAILKGYLQTGGKFCQAALDSCLVARAAVMTAWYPILYPNLTEERRAKLELRLAYLREHS